jgi:hypothetical protein
MSTTAKDILDEVRSSYLNDPSGNEATDAILLSHLRTAHGLMTSELEQNKIQVINEEVIMVIPAGANEYNPLPNDLVVPHAMYERTPNSTDEFRSMTYRNNLPQITAISFLEYWTYRLDRIFFVPATVDREVKLIYSKSYPVPQTSDANLINRSQNYLAAATAAIYLRFVRQNFQLSDAAKVIADGHMDDLINNQVKLMQSEPIRRKGYMPFRNR